MQDLNYKAVLELPDEIFTTLSKGKKSCLTTGLSKSASNEILKVLEQPKKQFKKAPLFNYAWFAGRYTEHSERKCLNILNPYEHLKCR